MNYKKYNSQSISFDVESLPTVKHDELKNVQETASRASTTKNLRGSWVPSYPQRGQCFNMQ